MKVCQQCRRELPKFALTLEFALELAELLKLPAATKVCSAECAYELGIWSAGVLQAHGKTARAWRAAG